jgi:hypothetical protein
MGHRRLKKKIKYRSRIIPEKKKGIYVGEGRFQEM